MPYRWRPGLAIAGLAGALLTIYPPISYPVQAAAGLEILAGAWLGLALAVNFWIAERNRSIARALAITALSAAAFWFAFLVTAGIELALIGAAGGFERAGVKTHALSLFGGGGVGGLVLGTSVFFLYGGGAEFLFRRIGLCSIAGGVLGITGYWLGEGLQHALSRDAFTLAGLCLVWQTGIGVLLSFIWPQFPAPVPAPQSGRFGSKPVRVLIAAVLVVVAGIPIVSTLRGARARQDFKQQQAAFEAYRAQHPPRTELPHVLARPAEQVMILEPIGGNHFTSLPVWVIPPNEYHPELADYLACYSNVGGSTCAAIEVRVREYQTPQWAAYAARGLPAQSGSGLGLGTEAVIEQFGQRIYHLPLALPRRDVYWVSGPYIVRVSSSFNDIDPIVRAYLERYRSSL